MPGTVSLNRNDSPVTRSGGKRRNVAAESSVRSTTSNNLKKTRVSLQLDFNASLSTRSPVVKKIRDSQAADPRDAALIVQNLLNAASQNGCLRYVELPKIDSLRLKDSSGRVRAIIPKQLEGLNLERPVMPSGSKPLVHIIKPDAPVTTLNDVARLPRSSRARRTNLQYLIVIDFESTCWEASRTLSPPPEIIEFPAVLLNLQTGKIEEEFRHFVMPTEMPKLSEFCTNLTGISQNLVDTAPPLKTCLNLFLAWVDSVTTERSLFQANSTNPSPSESSRKPLFAFVTWTDWDLRVCLQQECIRKEITFPSLLKQWIDLKAAFRKNYGWTPKGLQGALTDVGLTFMGSEHCGLDDARNTALLAFRMIGDGSVLDQFSEI